MQRHAIDIYTDVEEVFLEKALDLLEIHYTKTDSNEGITHKVITFDCDNAQWNVLYTALRYNYTKNFN